MFNRIELRMYAKVLLLSVTFALVVGSRLNGAEPNNAAPAQDAMSWFKEHAFITPLATFVAGVIIALVGSRLMKRNAPNAEARIQDALPVTKTKQQPKPEPKPMAKQPPKAARSEAITLLATLQREARFVDFIKEPLEGYSDAQIGAAARDVHRDCCKVLDRLFAIQSLVSQEEGSTLEVPAGFDAGRYRLTGNVAGHPPFQGRLVHHGWEAAEVQLPAWTGTPQSARVIAPIEVELT